MCALAHTQPILTAYLTNSLFFIAALPEEGPRITGGRPRYQIGDVVRVNCSSGRSKPAAHLTWYINGDPADQSLLRSYDPVITGREGLETSILGLEFRVKPRHFRRGDMKLKVCQRLMPDDYGYISSPVSMDIRYLFTRTPICACDARSMDMLLTYFLSFFLFFRFVYTNSV